MGNEFSVENITPSHTEDAKNLVMLKDRAKTPQERLNYLSPTQRLETFYKNVP